MNVTLTPIGIIHSPYKTKEECPVQGVASSGANGTVELYPEYEEGLLTIETFSHIYLFYLFDRAGEVKLARPTFLDDTAHGVFASRHPCRPNGIGMSVVQLEKRDGTILHVSEIDVLDDTPLIDIKPYVPRFDFREGADNGWVGEVQMRDKPAGRE
jgi:tRNA (adenine37-N6)-methyltransferase